mgnify:CR=1 FL=1
MNKTKCAIIGSGNIGTDLMLKIVNTSESLILNGVIGIDPESEGLAMAKSFGIPISSEGLKGFIEMDEYHDTSIFFDATSAGAHSMHHDLVAKDGKQMIDLTPAAIGPYCVPVVNLSEHLKEQNVNMVTCGGQATIPMVAAVNQISSVKYAEIVASVSSRSAGPGTRANIDEFTQTTKLGLEKVGGADKAKAIIVLNPAEPPLLMRNTVFTLCDPVDQELVKNSIESMVKRVQSYVPGYRVKQEVQFERFGSNNLIVRSQSSSNRGVSMGANSVNTLTLKDMEALKEELPAIKAIAPRVSSVSYTHLTLPTKRIV